jgi:hypothetical protein
MPNLSCSAGNSRFDGCLQKKTAKVNVSLSELALLLGGVSLAV